MKITSMYIHFLHSTNFGEALILFRFAQITKVFTHFDLNLNIFLYCIKKPYFGRIFLKIVFCFVLFYIYHVLLTIYSTTYRDSRDTMFH